MSDTNSFSATRAIKKYGDFAETTAFERYGVKTANKMSTGLPRPGLARSAHRRRIKFISGYIISKSSVALNPLTIRQLASL